MRHYLFRQAKKEVLSSSDFSHNLECDYKDYQVEYCQKTLENVCIHEPLPPEYNGEIAKSMQRCGKQPVLPYLSPSDPVAEKDSCRNMEDHSDDSFPYRERDESYDSSGKS